MPLGRSAATASSLTAPGVGANTGGAGAQQWQWDIWGLYDTMGPLKFTGMYRGNMYRRVRLGIGVRPENDPDGIPIAADDILDPDKPEVTAPPGVPVDLIRQAQAELGRIRGKFGKQAVLYDIGVNLSMAGECRLAVSPDQFEPNGELWQVYSVIELRQAGMWPDGTPRWTESGPPARVLPQGTIVWRIHNPHPGRHAMSDSSAMGVISDLRELELIGKQFRSLVKSRVPQTGMILMASEMGLGIPADPDNPDGPSKLATTLTKHMSTAIRSEEAASNVVPPIVEAPFEFVKETNAFRFIETPRAADELLDAREERKLRSFAIGMDTPPETILGIGDVNHWNGAQVSEDSWKAHGEPGMVTICGQLTGGPIRSMLAAAAMYADAGGPNVDVYGIPAARWTPQQIAQIVVIHDAAAVVSRPDRGKDAKDLHAAYALSDASLREATNFSESDAPDPDEIDQRIERERVLKTRDAPVQAIPPGYVAGPPGRPGEILPGAPPDSGTPSDTRPRTQLGQAVSGRTAAPAAPARTAALRTLVSARVAPAGRPVTADRTSTRRRDPGVRLADIDRQLFAGIQAAAQAAIRRTLERHGSVIRNRSQRNRAVNDAAKSVRPSMVAATLGRTVVASLGVTEDDLDIDYADLLDDVDRRVERARAAGLAALVALAASYGQTLTDAQLAEYEANAQAATAAGRAWLEESLTGLTRTRLYEPGEDGRIVGPGEGLEDGTVPPGVIRTAMSVYGGQQLDANGLPIDEDPYRGVAAGADNLSVGSLLGIDTDVWQWAHGSPANPFEPHEDLDGEIFGGDSDDDGRRDNTTDRWIGSGEFFPGDHQGCTCWAIPLISPPEA